MDMFSYLMGKSSGGGKGALVPVVVEELPEIGEAGKLYLVPKEEVETSDEFDEYIYVNEKWELLGTAKIDISGKQDKLTAGNYITIDQNNVISFNGKVTKVYQINFTDLDQQYYDYFAEWLNNYKNNIDSIIIVYYNYSVAIADLDITYNNGNGNIKIRTSYLNENYDISAYGITLAEIDAHGREATITNDIISKVSGWYKSSGGALVKSNSSSKVLGVNNTKEYSVSNDYTPAHKKYVDDAVAGASGDITNLENRNFFVIKGFTDEDKQRLLDIINYSIETGITPILAVRNGNKQFQGVLLEPSAKIVANTSLIYFTYGYTTSPASLLGSGMSEKVAHLKLTNLQWENDKLINFSWQRDEYDRQFALATNNTTAYTPTSDYNPATKKYVDDSIASAITDALGGDY